MSSMTNQQKTIDPGGWFFNDVMGDNDDSGSSIKTVSTQNPMQKELTSDMLMEAIKSFNSYRPYQGATQRMQPTAGEQNVFNRGNSMVNQIGQRSAGGNANLQKAQQAAGRERPKAPDSPSMIVSKGYSSMIQKLLSSGGGS